MTAPAAFNSAIYVGSVVHTRLRPVRHRLRYRMFTLLLDLDELPALARTLVAFSAERFNLFSFYGRDHLDGTKTPLRARVERELARGGIALNGGPIRLLSMPRVLGSVFNPLSVFFCYGTDGFLRALIYEVSNTFGERHSYLIPVAPGNSGSEPLRQRCAKTFYVSPFMDMALEYHFRVAPPHDRVAVAIAARDPSGPVLSACFAGQRQDLTDRNLLRGFIRHPALAAQVLGSIHWEALKLWKKGMHIRPRPAPPPDPVSLVIPVEQV